ncbi:tudor domain-containing protein 1-like [Aphomia sociella]
MKQRLLKDCQFAMIGIIRKNKLGIPPCFQSKGAQAEHLLSVWISRRRNSPKKLKIPALQRVRSRACVKCGAEDASSFCARCGVTPYCSLVCQRRDWADRHRAVCHNLARLPGGRLEGQAINTTDDQSGIPPAAPLRRPYSPAKGGKPEFQRHDQNSDKQDKIFTPPGQNARQPARNNNFNRGRNNSYNRNRPMNDRRPQKQDSQEDESWEKGPTKPESTDDKPISPKKTPYPPKEYHKPNDATPKRNEPEVPKTVPQEPAKPESRNDKAPQTPVDSKVVKESKPPATLANVTPVKKALVPKNYLIELLSINDTVLLSVDSAASDCATKRSGFVCLSMHESYQEQYQQLCEDYVVDCEADTTSFTPAVGNLFSYLSSADGGWYRARLLAVGKAALLDAARLVKLESTTTCRALPEKYRNSPEFCCLLDAAVKIGDNLTCKILSKHNDGYKVHIENIETNTVVGEGVVSRWEPVVEYPLPQKPQIPEVIRPDVVNNSKVLLVDMTASDRAFVRSAEASALRKYDDVLQNVVLAAANASPLTEPPQQGQTVIGQFTDGLYYRALCKRTNVKQNKYLLEYIDFGNVEISCLEKIYPCPAEYDARSLPTLASLVCLPPGGLPLTPPAVDYIEKLKDSCAELLLTIPSGAKTAPSGSAVSLTVVKNNQSVNKRIEELCTPEWKKFEEKGGDVVDMESVMYTDLEYLELPAKGCEVEILDISTLEGGTVSGCERNVKHTVFDSLTDRMAEYCNSELGREPYLPKHEELCIAKFPPYPQWFRAVLLEQVPGDPEARVCYVDYGNVGLVAVAALRKMLPEFVRGHPAVASHLEIKDFPKDPTAEMLARGVQHMKINDEGRGVLRVSRCEKQEPGFYIVEAPELIAAMKG